MLTYDKEYENIILVLDTKCPYINSPQSTVNSPQFEKYIKYVSDLVKKQSLPHNFIMPYQEDTITLAILKNLGGFKALALEHKKIFDEYLIGAQLSTRSFANIYIWSDLFNILWKIIDDNLCIFYEYKNEFNMLIPPIAKNERRGDPLWSPTMLSGQAQGPAPTILQCIKLLKPQGRIENIAEEEIKILKDCKIKIYKNTDEYIYLAKDLAELKGNRFASHRASINQFVKNQKYTYRPFDILDMDTCLELYRQWAKQRKEKCSDSVYQKLLEENFTAHKRAMLDYETLRLIGRVVEVDGKIRAYTFAFKSNDNATYCVMLETADLSITGLAQYIYKTLAQELVDLGAKHINAMDDSGMENLKKVKLSYRPYKILSNYIGVI